MLRHFRSGLSPIFNAGYACTITPVTRVDDFKVKLEPSVMLKIRNGTKMPTEAAFVACEDRNGDEFKVSVSVCVGHELSSVVYAMCKALKASQTLDFVEGLLIFTLRCIRG